MEEKNPEQQNPKFRFIVHSPPDPELVIKSLFGMSSKELAADIRLNKGGKWDHLFQHKGDKKEEEE